MVINGHTSVNVGNHEFYYGSASEWRSLLRDTYKVHTMFNTATSVGQMCLIGLDEHVDETDQ
jgi:hypothetical protein